MIIAALGSFIAPTVRGCDCVEISVGQARSRAEIIFRGRITGFRDRGDGGSNVVFAVDRVWNGNIPETFEMPALKESVACLGFWPAFLKIDNELLVYAYRLEKPSGNYLTDICSRTAVAEKTKDFAVLGAGHAPRKRK